jgi:hypothetical protein
VDYEKTAEDSREFWDDIHATTLVHMLLWLNGPPYPAALEALADGWEERTNEPKPIPGEVMDRILGSLGHFGFVFTLPEGTYALREEPWSATLYDRILET